MGAARRFCEAAVLLVLLAMPGPPAAGQEAPATIAVAANFSGPVHQLAAAFHDSTGLEVVPVFGSTGKLYAQITHGAPFAAFLAADEERPQLLEKEGRAIAGSRFTYAVGRLVLWSSLPALIDSAGGVPAGDRFGHLAVANPRLAPYGRAAREVLEALGSWDVLQGQIVRGESIAQAFHFVRIGNAELGFVALSQYRALASDERGSAWLVPAKMHAPIRQQAVLLSDDPAAAAFLEFLKSPSAQGMIRESGYDPPR